MNVDGRPERRYAEQLVVPCPSCGARRLHACRTDGGTITAPHASRRRAAVRAHERGADGVAVIDLVAERVARGLWC